MYKDLKFDIEARESILKGVNKVYGAVSTTLGPKANNVAIAREWGTPTVLHDGVSVAREVTPLKDKYENVGAELIKGAADKMDSVGDGTTLTTILTHAIATEAHKNIVAGANSMLLRKGIDAAVDKICDNVDKISQPIETSEQIKQIATISAQDEEIGELVSTAIEKLGRDAIITVEESNSSDMSIDYKEGMAFDKGYSSHHFVNKPESGECIIDNPLILITDSHINQMPEFMKFLGVFAEKQEGTPNTSLVIISNGVDGAPLATLIANKLQGRLQPLVVNAPGYGEKQKDFLEDIAIITGGTLISRELGLPLDKFEISHFGKAKKVISTKDSTTIIGGMGDEKEIKERVSLINNQIEKSTGDYDREKLQERLAKLTSGIAVINVGASSEAEMREKKERCIDAISATKAAIDGGIVSGGETTLVNASHMALLELENKNRDIQTGMQIVLNACTYPFAKLMENSGYNSGEMYERLKNQKIGYGIDVMDGEIKDMIKAGIIDPANVAKSALKYSSSAAIMIMTTNCVIVEEKDGQES